MNFSSSCDACPETCTGDGAVVHDLRAGAVQRVDDARHVRLVAGDRVRADHDDVVGGDLHVLVLVRGHQRQRAHRLTLRTGADDADVAGRVAGGLLDVDDRVRGQVDEAALARHRDVLQHRTADERDLAPVRDRGLRDLLHAVQVRREARDDEALVGVLAEQRAHRGADRRLRRREPGALGIGRVGEQEPDAAVAGGPARPSSARSVWRPSTGVRSSLKSPVWTIVPSGVKYATAKPCGTECVTGMNWQSIGPMRTAFAVGDGDELGAVEHPRFVDAVPGQRERQRRAVDRDRDVAQQEGQAAGVVLVRVGEQDGFDPIGVVAEVGEVGQDEVDAGHVGVGEHDPAVDDQDPAVDLDAEAVPADLAEAAEKYDPDRHQPCTLQRCRRRRAAARIRQAFAQEGDRGCRHRRSCRPTA